MSSSSPSRRVFTWVFIILAGSAAGLVNVYMRSDRGDDPAPPVKKVKKVKKAPGVEVKEEEKVRAPPPGGAAEVPGGEPRDDAVPHPFFPTAEAAGTKQLFFLEEPPRGPLLASVKKPRPGGLRWTRHAHCELDAGGVVCGGATRKAGAGRSWRVGRRGKRVTLAEERVGPRVERSLLLERNPAGKLTRVASFDSRGTMTRAWIFDPPGERFSARQRSGGNDLRGCGYMQVKLDAAGRPRELGCLQWLLKPMKDARGVAITTFERDARGFVTRETRLDIDRSPTTGRDSVHRLAVQRDAAGRRISTRGFGMEGEPVISTATGCHQTKLIRDARGLVTERSCHDVKGLPAPDMEEVLTRRYAHDAAGCKIREWYLDAAGQAAAAFSGVHIIKRKVDRHCEPRRWICLGRNQERVPCSPGGAAEYRQAHDRLGQVVRRRHYAAEGGPGKGDDCGEFEMRYGYDARGNTVSDGAFDKAGRPVECSRTGFHGTRSRFDGAGREQEKRFVDTKGAPTDNVGTHVRRFTYDNYDHLYESREFGADGKPVQALGAAFKRYLYDATHQMFGMLLFDRGGRPARFSGCFTGHKCPAKPWHAVRVVRTSKGLPVQNLFFDGDRRMILRIDCQRHPCWK